MMEEARSRINSLNLQMEALTRRKKSAVKSEQIVFVETLFLAKTIKQDDHIQPKRICADLRGLAIKAQEISPAIAAHLDLMANEFQNLQ